MWYKNDYTEEFVMVSLCGIQNLFGPCQIELNFYMCQLFQFLCTILLF